MAQVLGLNGFVSQFLTGMVCESRSLKSMEDLRFVEIFFKNSSKTVINE